MPVSREAIITWFGIIVGLLGTLIDGVGLYLLGALWVTLITILALSIIIGTFIFWQRSNQRLNKIRRTPVNEENTILFVLCGASFGIFISNLFFLIEFVSHNAIPPVVTDLQGNPTGGHTNVVEILNYFYNVSKLLVDLIIINIIYGVILIVLLIVWLVKRYRNLKNQSHEFAKMQ